jgi:hypothetical protein
MESETIRSLSGEGKYIRRKSDSFERMKTPIREERRWHRNAKRKLVSCSAEL